VVVVVVVLVVVVHLAVFCVSYDMYSAVVVECEGGAAAGDDVSNVCTWLWSLGVNDWLQLPGIPALGQVCAWQSAGSRQCYGVPRLGSHCACLTQLHSLRHNS